MLFLPLVALGLLAPPALSEHPKPADPATPSADDLVELMVDLGDHEMPITTDAPLAQQYFNQGLRLMYGFNHDEARRAFRAAAHLDPECAMAWWGIALSLGSNYNMPMDEAMGKAAYAAEQKALELAPGTTPKEQAFIEALKPRYADPPPEERKALDEAYAVAMGKLAEKYPDDVDAAVLYAEAMMDLRPWELWTPDGQPQPGTEEILKTLEGAMAQAPNHPGANHYYIHAVESAVPEKGIAAAERLAKIAPGAGHLVHMPAHIYFRVGRYNDASQANQAAAKADEAYIAKYKPQGLYPMMYYPHNIHFLWASAAMEGRSKVAIDAATETSKKIPDAMVKEMPMVEAFVPTRLFALVRFHKWDEILAEPAPDPEFHYATGMWHYARGMAYAHKNEVEKAKEEDQKLVEIAQATPEDQLVMQHKAVDLLNIAVNHLKATLLARTDQDDAAAEKLREAVAQQDALRYDAPPPWYMPMRQALGNQLLDMNQPAEAEQAFRKDLQEYPENGWSLAGLERSLRAQIRNDEADAVHERFEKAWPEADIEPH
jgi:tetratricopeptide (TPR) repeat protein